jgi:hypothetical protein
MDDITNLFNCEFGNALWISRICGSGSGADLHANLEAHAFVTVKHLASWMIMEKQYDNICRFLSSTFGYYIVRERQNAKIRIEVNSCNDDGSERLLSTMFDVIETNRGILKLQDYAIAQTSLEQIFNYFAAQQEEEIGNAAGISSATAPSTVQVTTPSVVTTAVAQAKMPVSAGRVVVKRGIKEIEMTNQYATAENDDDVPPDYEP